MNKLNNLSNLKSKFKKIVAIIAIFCAIAVSNQIQTYQHIPLKSLFKVLKKDDIGFGHALLHSGWIENIYQYGAGKPHREIVVRRNRKKWKTEDKGDAVANLVRKFWFRRSENHQLLPTQFGCLANIPNDKLGKVFGQLINHVHQGFNKESQDKLIDTLVPYAQNFEQYRQEQTVLCRELIDQEYALKHDKKFDALRQVNLQLQEEIARLQLQEKFNMTELNRQIAQVSKVCKEDTSLNFGKKKKEIESNFDRKGYTRALKEAKERIFSDIDQEILDEYRSIELSVKRLQVAINKKVKQKRDEIQKELLILIAKSLEFCANGKIYEPRTTQGILWALFFHKLDSLISLGDKIKAINDCLSIIEDEFKNQEFCGCVELKDLYNQEDFDNFEEKIKKLGVNNNPDYYKMAKGKVDKLNAKEQVNEICQEYDLGLHYFISRVAGKFPPAIAQGSYGYEYEEGKISHERPDCHETATLDMLSLLWFNPTKNAFDDSLFPERVLQNGQGLKRLREALKYIYFADKKKIKPDEYTCSFDGAQDREFTSIAKLKKLGKISPEEVEKLDISEVPVSYITRAEVKQEFFNIVSGMPEVLYCSKSTDEEKDFELETDVRSVVKICNYFYGTDIEDIIELGDKAKGISTGSRTITFGLENDKNTLNAIDVSVSDDENHVYFSMKMDIEVEHTSFSVPGREKAGSKVLKEEASKIILSKILTEKEVWHQTEKLLPFLLLISSTELLYNHLYDDKKIAWNISTLNLLYYSLLLKDPMEKESVIVHALGTFPQYYNACKKVIHNLLDLFPRNDVSLQTSLARSLMLLDFYKKEPSFQNFIAELLDEPTFYENTYRVYDILKKALKKGHEDVALKIIGHPKFDAGQCGLGGSLVFAFKNKKYDIISSIVENSTFKNDAGNWEGAIDFAIKQSWENIALEIVNHARFDPNDGGNMGYGLKFLLAKGYKKLFLEVTKKPEFNWGKQPSMGGVLQVALKQGYKNIALEIVNHLTFDASKNGVVYALREALRTASFPRGTELDGASSGRQDEQYREIALKIVRDSKFDASQPGIKEVLSLALKNQLDNIALELVKNSRFTLDTWDFRFNFGFILTDAMEYGNKNIATILINHPTFNSNRVTEWDLLHILKLGYRDVVLDIMNHPTFDPHKVNLKQQKKYLQNRSDSVQELRRLQELKELIESKRKKITI